MALECGDKTIKGGIKRRDDVKTINNSEAKEYTNKQRNKYIFSNNC